MDESQDVKPHPVVHEHSQAEATAESMSIWFFVGVLSLAYGLVLLVYGGWAWLTNHEAPTVLANLHPTFWWGVVMTAFGGFFTIRFRPGKG